MSLIREKFHTFDALRLFSFLLVFMQHLPYAMFPQVDFLSTRGDIGVSFFFVLSGFLITYILLVEKKASGNFDFKKYMVRRILRIWPLYYLILWFAFFTPVILNIIGLSSGNAGYSPNWLMSALFLENYMVMYYGDYANVSPLPVIWSLCIEEHFYIIWGLILFFNPVRNILYWITGLILLSNISRYYFDAHDIPFKEILTNFDYFMYGAIPAYCYVNFKVKTIKVIRLIPDFYKITIIIAAITYCLGAAHFDFYLQNLTEPLILGIFFSSILFIILPKENRFGVPDNNIFSKLGVYTYGLYMLHTIFINLGIKLNEKWDFTDSQSIQFLAIFGFSLFTTVFSAMLCYHFFEKTFLRLKRY